MDKLKNFINNLDDAYLIDFLIILGELKYMDDEKYETIESEWKEIIEEYSPEHILSILTSFTNDKIIDLNIDKYIRHADLSNFTIMELEKEGLQFNRSSILMSMFPYEEDYITYLDLSNNDIFMSNKHINFIEKYGVDEKIDIEGLNIKLALLRYELENVREFVIKIFGELDYYEIKHYKINIFFQVWNIYKELDHADKERFLLNVIKPYFMNINWRTVSRLYNPDDKEFVKIFVDYIDVEFALIYNPYFKR